METLIKCDKMQHFIWVYTVFANVHVYGFTLPYQSTIGPVAKVKNTASTCVAILYMTNNVDPNEKVHIAASHQDQHFLQNDVQSIFNNTKKKK